MAIFGFGRDCDLSRSERNLQVVPRITGSLSEPIVAIFGSLVIAAIIIVPAWILYVCLMAIVEFARVIMDIEEKHENRNAAFATDQRFKSGLNRKILKMKKHS